MDKIMPNYKEELEPIMSDAQTMLDVIKVLGYAAEFMNYICHDEVKLRTVAGHIAGGINCIADYQQKIIDEMEKIMDSQG